jgi:hypothetical protein
MKESVIFTCSCAESPGPTVCLLTVKYLSPEEPQLLYPVDVEGTLNEQASSEASWSISLN